MSSPARSWSAITVACASRNCSRKWTSSSAVSSGRPHRPRSYQRGRGHEPVTVAGSIRSLVAVSIGRRLLVEIGWCVDPRSSVGGPEVVPATARSIRLDVGHKPAGFGGARRIGLRDPVDLAGHLLAVGPVDGHSERSSTQDSSLPILLLDDIAVRAPELDLIGFRRPAGLVGRPEQERSFAVAFQEHALVGHHQGAFVPCLHPEVRGHDGERTHRNGRLGPAPEHRGDAHEQRDRPHRVLLARSVRDDQFTPARATGRPEGIRDVPIFGHPDPDDRVARPSCDPGTRARRTRGERSSIDDDRLHLGLRPSDRECPNIEAQGPMPIAIANGDVLGQRGRRVDAGGIGRGPTTRKTHRAAQGDGQDDQRGESRVPSHRPRHEEPDEGRTRRRTCRGSSPRAPGRFVPVKIENLRVSGLDERRRDVRDIATGPDVVDLVAFAQHDASIGIEDLHAWHEPHAIPAGQVTSTRRWPMRSHASRGSDG